MDMSQLVVSPGTEERKASVTQTALHANPGRRMFGASLADVFRAPDYDCRLVGSDERPTFAITRLRSSPRETGIPEGLSVWGSRVIRRPGDRSRLCGRRERQN